MEHWIDDPERLGARLESWRGAPTIGLDTEFIRERTYFPQLALVQLAVAGETLLVDPLVDGMAARLRPLLADAATTKVMHSASEDLQALLRGCGAPPDPVFDTQVAAAMAGMGAGLGYQKLVENITGVSLAKGQTRSDWLRRPLSEEQRHYAAEDVAHLDELHRILESRLVELGRLDWLREDCARAVRIASSDADDPHPHLALRSAQSLDGDGQVRLNRLLRWRDREARRGDRPKGWVLDNELAVLLSRRPPVDSAAFRRLLDEHPRSPRKSRGELWDVLNAPIGEAERQIPLAVADPVDRQRLKRFQQAVVDLARSLDVPEGLLCARRHLEALLERNQWPEPLEGWRRGLLEPVLAPLLSET